MSENIVFSSSSDKEQTEIQSQLKNQLEELKQRQEQVSKVVPQQEQFKIPREKVILPSRGLLYPKDSNLYNSEFVEIRHMTANEEDILTSRSLLRSGEAIDELLKACLVDKSIKPGILIPGDKNAILIALRIGAYGIEYYVDIECSECSENNKDYCVNLGTLNMNTLDLIPINEGENEFEFVLPSSNSVVFKFLNSEEEKELSTLIDLYKKRTNSRVDKNVSFRHKKQILAVNGDTNRNTIDKFVDQMMANDSRSLNKYINDNEPKILFETDFTCKNCGYSGRESAPLGASFFWPD